MTPTELRISKASSETEIRALVDEIRKDWLSANKLLEAVEDELLHINSLHEKVIDRAMDMGRAKDLYLCPSLYR